MEGFLLMPFAISPELSHTLPKKRSLQNRKR
jgi:hypothetical protein